jgi:hypothetical protein
VSRFPELSEFELEMNAGHGWSTVRANEHEVAAHVLDKPSSVSLMLAGGHVTAELDGHRYLCRLTPKAWLTTHRSQP